MNCPAVYGCGVAFRLTPNSDGSWTESLLPTFCSTADCADGSFPEAALAFDKAGNLYKYCGRLAALRLRTARYSG